MAIFKRNDTMRTICDNCGYDEPQNHSKEFCCPECGCTGFNEMRASELYEMRNGGTESDVYDREH